MAGTTIADDGVVAGAFAAALDGAGLAPGSPRFAEAMAHVAASMGQHKLAVFSRLLGDDAAARRATARFEEAYDEAVRASAVVPLPGASDAIARLRGGGCLVALTTGFSPHTRDAILDAVGWREAVDLAVSPADAFGRGRPSPAMIHVAMARLAVDDVREVATAGDTTSDLVAGWRAGASIVAGVLTGSHDRETLAAAPHTHLLASVADLPDVVARGSTGLDA